MFLTIVLQHFTLIGLIKEKAVLPPENNCFLLAACIPWSDDAYCVDENRKCEL